MDALEVACPTCHAKPGVHCKRPSGHRIFGGGSHASREKAAETATPVSPDFIAAIAGDLHGVRQQLTLRRKQLLDAGVTAADGHLCSAHDHLLDACAALEPKSTKP